MCGGDGVEVADGLMAEKVRRQMDSASLVEPRSTENIEIDRGQFADSNQGELGLT